MAFDPQTHSKPIAPDELRDVFANHGLRTTRQREVVYQVLSSCTSHPTADELMDLVHKIDPEVSQATIYNTLDALVLCKLARRIPSPNSGGACRYDGDIGEHVHLLLKDGRVMDVPMDLSQRIIDAIPESILAELRTRTGISDFDINIELVAH